jgi:hypothetical protein
MAQDKFSIPPRAQAPVFTREVEIAISRAGYYGLTWREIENRYGRGHSTVSSALTRLHSLGKIERLAEKRERCSVYVIPLQGSMRGRKTISPKITERLPSDHALCEATEATLLSTIDALQRQVEEYKKTFGDLPD